MKQSKSKYSMIFTAHVEIWGAKLYNYLRHQGASAWTLTGVSLWPQCHPCCVSVASSILE
jgi:hypothetical protein